MNCVGVFSAVPINPTMLRQQSARPNTIPTLAIL
jgi:hypothetical protein